MREYDQDLESYETDLVSRFRQNPEFLRAMELQNEHFEEVLLQKRFLSGNFKELYRKGIANAQDRGLISIAERILADEYVPEDHEILLDQDLRTAGITTDRIECAIATSTTLKTIERAYDLVKKRETDCDIWIAAGLRLYGELLVGEEYARIFPELERRYVLTRSSSRFFYPHLVHDRKLVGIGDEGVTHTDQFSLVLDSLVDSGSKLVSAKEAMEAAYTARRDFWSQF